MSKRRKPPEPRRTVAHPRYGDVPLVSWTWVGPDGTTVERRSYDPAYRPPLPPGAVRGDITKQIYCCDFPYYYYLPIERTCVQCKQAFTFGAAEQKFWYETLQFNLTSTAIRCVDCRKKRRTEASLREALARSLHAIEKNPADALSHLALAEATAAFRERTGQGNLDRALASARRARKLAPELHEALYWEGELQVLAGRDEAGRAALSAYLAQRGSGRLASAAQKRLALLGRSTP